MSQSGESHHADLEEEAGLSPDAQFDRLLGKSHPLMVEAFSLAAIPHWYDRGLFAAIRHADDGRDDGLYERLQRYTFVTTLQPARYGVEQAEPLFCIRYAEREALHRRWIAKDVQAYREAHRRALAYMREHPDPNRYAQAQNELYHLLFVDQDAGVDQLAALFRSYRNERTLIAIDRLLDTAGEAATYLALIDGESAADLGDLLTFLRARLDQLRGDWVQSQAALAELRRKGDGLNRRLRPYVVRAEGHALAKEKKYVEAIQAYREAYRQFSQLVASEREPSVVQVERGHTLMALGDAHVDLAESVGGYQERKAPRSGVWQGVRSVAYFVVSLPLVLYLSRTLGRRVWNPRFWPVLIGLDWIIARLVTSGVRSYHQADALLEDSGQPGERRMADEKLASVSLKLGDSTQARQLLQSLLDQTEAPLGPYRQAVARVGLAEAHLHLQQPEQALAQLREALPVFETYEDKNLQTRAGELLGQALLEAGEQEEALGCLEAVCAQYQRSEAWAEATRLAEHLQAWLQAGADGALPTARERAQALVAGLKQRRYAGHYRHPWLVRFRQAVLTLLPVVLLLAPLLTIHLESSITLSPQIRFRPQPILDPSATLTAQISEGVARSEVYRVVVSDMALGVMLGFVLMYLLASLLLGLLAITFTPLRSVQEGGRVATVCLDEDGIARGEDKVGAREGPRGPPEAAAPAEAVPWSDIAEFVQADVRLWNQSLQDNSHFGLAALQEPLVVEGHTAWYDSLRDQVRSRLPSGAKAVNLSFDVLRSPLGILYLLNLASIGALALLVLFVKPSSGVYDLPGTEFAVDLYPFFYLFLVVTPLWWGVIQPLRRRLHLQPHSRLPLTILAAGLLLTLIQALLRFRPLLTVINLYVPLATILLLASGAAAVWRAQVGGRKVFRTPVRVGGALLAGVACLLMLTVMVREVYSYYHLVRGNVLSTRALRIEQGPLAQPVLDRALAAYRRTEEIGSGPIWGLDTRGAAGFRLEIPPAALFPWLTAKASQAAWQVEMGNLDEASRIYSEMLEYTDQPDEIYATWAVARLGLATDQGNQESLKVDQTQYELGLNDLDKAIALNPDKAAYHVWRAVAYHALGQRSDCEELVAPGALTNCQEDAASGELNPLVEATCSYTMALTLGQSRDPQFSPLEQERAWTGLGWIQYLCDDYQQALASFQQAVTANPESSEARLAEGYALYALERFVDAQSVWEEAADLEPKDATILLALATAHWKLGGRAGQPPDQETCTEYQAAFDLFVETLDEGRFWEQTPKDLGFTHRTLAQMLYLLADCPGYVKVDTYKDAVDHYSQALKFDPGNGWFLYRRGTISRGLYLLQKTSTPAEAYGWLLKAIDDVSRSTRINPKNDNYRRDRDGLITTAEEQATTKGLESAAMLFQALDDFEKARQLEAEAQGTQYQPRIWSGDLRSNAIEGNLARGDESLAARDYAAALGYYGPVDPGSARCIPGLVPAGDGAGADHGHGPNGAGCAPGSTGAGCRAWFGDPTDRGSL
jgi:tetratricopeptide (TPR) repeat protein